MEGVASSSRPEMEVDQFLKALRSNARFSALVEDIQLRSIVRAAHHRRDAASGKGCRPSL